MITLAIDTGIKVAECEDRECVCVARIDCEMNAWLEAVLLWAYVACERGEA